MIRSNRLRLRVRVRLKSGNQWEYVAGGPLRNAIMFAMLTAVPAEVLNGQAMVN